MITWLLWIDSWEFPITSRHKKNDRLMLVVTSLETPKVVKVEGETEAERQRRLHDERWDYRDPSRPYIGNVDQPFPRDDPVPHEWDPPERVYETWERERPDEYDYYWSEPETQAPEKWEDWGRALAV